MSSTASPPQPVPLPPSPILNLPPEITFHILQALDPTDVSAFSQTCRHMSSYCSPRSNSHLWTTLFLRLFDPEPEREGEYYEILQSRIMARGLVTMARDKDQLDRVTSAYDPVVDVFVAMARSSNGTDESKNIDWLMNFFPPDSSAFTEAYLSSYGSTFRHTATNQLQSVAHFRLLHGRTWRIFEPFNRLWALKKVYQIVNFTCTTAGGEFGPVKKGTSVVDFELVDAIKRVMEFNVGTAITTEGWGATMPGGPIQLPSLDGWRATAPRLPSLASKKAWDWAGVEKKWVGSYSFMDWDVFALLNSGNATSLHSLAIASQLEAMAEAIGDCMSLTLSLTSLPPLPASSPSHIARPPLDFTGTLGPSSRSQNQPTLNISGRVHSDKDGQVRWSYKVRYANQLQWVLEGVQVGGAGSKAGVVGVWTHASRLTEGMMAGGELGPCGPFWWWPVDD